MFDVAAESYDRFMGRYSTLLASPFADFAGVEPGRRVLDVGSGPGALTQELVRRGVDVSAVEPSESFAAAMRERFPGVEVHQAPAEKLPFEDGTFDAALAQLVVHFMADAVAGVAEMARVTRLGGIVAACVWDLAGGRAPMTPLWDVLGIDPGADARPGTAPGQLRAIFDAAGVADVEEGEISAPLEFASFEEWWEPFTLGVGPVGARVAALSPAELESARERVRSLLGGPPIKIEAVAWAARGYHVPSARAA